MGRPTLSGEPPESGTLAHLLPYRYTTGFNIFFADNLDDVGFNSFVGFPFGFKISPASTGFDNNMKSFFLALNNSFYAILEEFTHFQLIT